MELSTSKFFKCCQPIQKSLYKEIQENLQFSILASEKFLKYVTLQWLKGSQEPKLGNVSIPVQPCHGSCGSACEQEGENG